MQTSRKISRGDNSIVEYPIFQSEYAGSNPSSPLQFEAFEISISRAIELCNRWHSYCRPLPASTIHRNKISVAFKLVASNRIYGVAIFTSPVAENRFKSGLQMIELRRFAVSNDAGHNAASQMLAILRREIRLRYPAIDHVITYTARTKLGTTYQADNWTLDSISGQSMRWIRRLFRLPQRRRQR